MGNRVACLGDPSDHDGSIITVGTGHVWNVNGVRVCVQGAIHRCPREGHGDTPITAITVTTKLGGQRVLTFGAVAGCGAVIQPPDRKTNVS